MSETCVCGGSTANPNPDCERCQLVARIAELEAERNGWKRAFGQLAAQFISARSDLATRREFSEVGWMRERHDNRTAEIIDEAKRTGGVE